MLVRDLMTVPAHCCRTSERLGDAARLMLDQECGCVPVVDSHARVVGVLTDRDVCLAVATRPGNPREILVKAAMSPKVVSCSPDDPIDRALATMKEHRVRRLPVIDADGQAKGLLSIDDLIRNTGYAKGRLAAESVIDVLRHVCTPHVAPHEMITA